MLHISESANDLITISLKFDLYFILQHSSPSEPKKFANFNINLRHAFELK